MVVLSIFESFQVNLRLDKILVSCLYSMKLRPNFTFSKFFQKLYILGPKQDKGHLKSGIKPLKRAQIKRLYFNDDDFRVGCFKIF